MRRPCLFRWHKRTQLDVPTPRGWLSFGLDRRNGPRVIAYWSPDATPSNPRAKGFGCA